MRWTIDFLAAVGRRALLLLRRAGAFLGYLTARRDDDAVFVNGLTVPRVLSSILGAPATNKLLRKLEEVRLALWLEEAMQTGTTSDVAGRPSPQFMAPHRAA